METNETAWLAPGRRVESRWWYWIAFQVLIAVLFFAFVVLAVATFLSGSVGAPGPLFSPALLGAVVMVVLALLVSVMCPIAMFFDTGAIAESDVDWRPDQTMWTLFSVILPIQAFVAAYYLWRRHDRLGVP